jgi:hypothetical protein
VLGTSGDVELHSIVQIPRQYHSKAISDDDFVDTMGRAATSRSKSNAELTTLTSVHAASCLLAPVHCLLHCLQSTASSTASSPLPPVHCLQSTASSQLPPVNCLQSTASSQLPPVNCLQSTASRQLPPVNCLPSTTYCLLSSAACRLPDSAERSIRGGSRGASALHFDGSE